jgi:hypothetical protein
MSVSERITQAQEAARLRGDITSTWRDAPKPTQSVDGLGDFKSRVHDACSSVSARGSSRRRVKPRCSHW